MKDLWQIQLSGVGSQDVITIAVILAEAAILDGKNAVQTQCCSSEDQLDASESEVIFSTKKIAFPKVTKPDLLLCLSQSAFEKYFHRASPDTVVILDSTNIQSEIPSRQLVYKFPITETATKVGNQTVANIVALGVINALTGLVTPMSLRKAISQCIAEDLRALTERALEAGEKLIEGGACQLVHNLS